MPDGDEQPASDLAILAAIARQEPDALGTLYDRYGRLAFGLAYRMLGDAAGAEEVVQDAFMRVWRRAGSFDQQRGGVRAWLLTIVHHCAIDHTRRRATRRAGEVDFDALEPVLEAPDVWIDVLDGLRAESVRAALAGLPEEQRHTIELAYFDGLTQSEIAERTGVPLGTVKSRMRLGLRKLHDLLLATESQLAEGGADGS